jgi:hypothetical protein
MRDVMLRSRSRTRIARRLHTQPAHRKSVKQFRAEIFIITPHGLRGFLYGFIYKAYNIFVNFLARQQIRNPPVRKRGVFPH